jgi:hypothetical protein
MGLPSLRFNASGIRWRSGRARRAPATDRFGLVRHAGRLLGSRVVLLSYKREQKGELKTRRRYAFFPPLAIEMKLSPLFRRTKQGSGL